MITIDLIFIQSKNLLPRETNMSYLAPKEQKSQAKIYMKK